MYTDNYLAKIECFGTVNGTSRSSSIKILLFFKSS